MLLNFSSAENRFLFCKQLSYFLFFAFLILLLRSHSLKRILPPVVAGVSFILFLYGILQKFLLFPMMLRETVGGDTFLSQAIRSRLQSGRIFAIFELPTLYAMVCGFLLLFILHYMLEAGAKRRWPWALLGLAGVANLVLTKSFGGIIAFALSVITLLVCRRKIGFKHLLPAAMFLLLLGLIVTGMRFSEARSLEPLRMRFGNWLQAARLIGTSPVMGVGLGNYAAMIPPHVSAGEVPSVYAHNFLLQFAAETGLPLSAAFILLAILFAWKNSGRLSDPENAVFAAGLMQNLLFNAMDVGFYFFAAGITGAVCFSQLFPAPAGRSKVYISPCLAFLLVWLGISYTESLQRQADLLSSRKENMEAQRLYRRSLAVNPFSGQALVGLARLQIEGGDRAAAEDNLQKALGLLPRSGFANFLMSGQKFQKGEYLNALFYARAARDANKLNLEYFTWHEIIRQNFQKQVDRPGN